MSLAHLLYPAIPGALHHPSCVCISSLSLSFQPLD